MCGLGSSVLLACAHKWGPYTQLVIAGVHAPAGLFCNIQCRAVFSALLQYHGLCDVPSSNNLLSVAGLPTLTVLTLLRPTPIIRMGVVFGSTIFEYLPTSPVRQPPACAAHTHACAVGQGGLPAGGFC